MSNGTVMESNPKGRRKAGEGRKSKQEAKEGGDITTRHTKRLLMASFHRDPRELVDDVVAAQMECMRAWELAEANKAWDERREARFFPPPPVA